MITRRQLLIGSLGLGASALTSCAPRPAEELSTTVFCFDTVCQLRGVMDQEVLDGAVALCERFEQLFSRTIEGSDVSRINAAGGEAIKVDEHTATLIARSREYSEASGGLFDITIGAVTELWDFKEGVVPAPEAIEQALTHVGWQKLQVQGNTVQLADRQARIDLGGIAKGYIADELIGLFSRRGVKSASVNLGGNVAVLGSKADGSPWNVGVRDPFDESGASVIAKIATNGGSVVTSGLYERSFERDGKRYWHILDPRTGYPVTSKIVSATLYTQRSLDGDGYTKPLFMMEPDEALSFAEEHAGAQALLVLEDGSTCVTEKNLYVIA
ncbi:MAG: FAD:protein FMN transferase [Coriobacteriales bacterium]|nr:FAD:protein FMN transferase [Coriobacteriales bacterium]